MARPISPDHDNRKQTILDNCANVFAKEGYHKASLDQLAEASNISKALLYHYFSSKIEILYQSMLSHVTLLKETADQCMSRSNNAETTLKQLLQEFLSIYNTAGAHHRNLVNELDRLKPEQAQTIKKIEREIVDIFERLIFQITQEVNGTEQRKKIEAYLLISMINWTHTWFHADGSITNEQLVDTIFSIFLDGIKSTP